MRARFAFSPHANAILAAWTHLYAFSCGDSDGWFGGSFDGRGSSQSSNRMAMFSGQGPQAPTCCGMFLSTQHSGGVLFEFIFCIERRPAWTLSFRRHYLLLLVVLRWTLYRTPACGYLLLLRGGAGLPCTFISAAGKVRTEPDDGRILCEMVNSEWTWATFLRRGMPWHAAPTIRARRRHNNMPPRVAAAYGCWLAWCIEKRVAALGQ